MKSNMRRISVKFFVDDPKAVDLDTIIPVFHQWIQQSIVPGMLIDVADYRHIVNGPGVLLIGHEADYALSMRAGRPGLLYTRKRSIPQEMSSCLAEVFHSALLACRALEQEKSLPKKLRFRTDEVALTLADRLHATNDASTFASIEGDLTRFLRDLYDGTTVRIERATEDDRQCLTLRVTADDGPDLNTLIDRLAEHVPGTG